MRGNYEVGLAWARERNLRVTFSLNFTHYTLGARDSEARERGTFTKYLLLDESLYVSVCKKEKRRLFLVPGFSHLHRISLHLLDLT